MAAPWGLSPTLTVAARWPQPEWLVALQAAPLITETVSPSLKPLAADPAFGPYTVSVAALTARTNVPCPALATPGACPQREVCWALQVAAFTTATRFAAVPNGT